MPEWGVHGPVTVEGAPCGVSIRSRLFRMCGAPPRRCPLSSARTRGGLPFHTPPQFKKIGAFQHVREPASGQHPCGHVASGPPACMGTCRTGAVRIRSVTGLSHMRGNLTHSCPHRVPRKRALPHARGTLPMRTRTAFPALKAFPHAREPAVPRTPQPQSMLPSSGETRGESCGVSACPQDARPTSAIRATAFSVKRFRALARRAPSSRSASRPSE